MGKGLTISTSTGLAIAGALAVIQGAAAQPTSPYLSAWGVEDMKAAVTGSGAAVTRADVTAEGDPYIAAKSPSGVKFTVTGRLCDFAAGVRTGPKRCRGAVLTTRFSLASDAAVDAAVKKWAREYAAVSVSNGGDNNVLVMRYLIFDHGLHRDNLKVNISVFTGVAEEIWAAI
ncbi:hypothetical protein [Caulobacter mirabilis]|uniref:YbjN domain-containing protein n=1 Tax=Caulobacter mirabilis TaxID=69666 RepID=A0A2D2AV37_9CAUL|nr:hypothetical protein [Caulobacter mirabilis]ATQ41858.1 hypothetical protein CSW64_05240 [Caulobacter mirabilis]